MKYIDADKLSNVIDKITDELKKKANPNPLGTIDDMLVATKIELMQLVKQRINEIIQEGLDPLSIAEICGKKGWLDYGLTVGEIDLHLFNARRRLAEHRCEFEPSTIPNLYHVAEYYKAVGSEVICCCLLGYVKDSIFTSDDVKNILRKDLNT